MIIEPISWRPSSGCKSCGRILPPDNKCLACEEKTRSELPAEKRLAALLTFLNCEIPIKLLHLLLVSALVLAVLAAAAMR